MPLRKRVQARDGLGAAPPARHGRAGRRQGRTVSEIPSTPRMPTSRRICPLRFRLEASKSSRASVFLTSRAPRAAAGGRLRGARASCSLRRRRHGGGQWWLERDCMRSWKCSVSALVSGEACRGAALSHWAAVDAPPGLARRSSKAAGAGIGAVEKASIHGLGEVPAKSMSETRRGGGSPAPARGPVVVPVRVGAPRTRCCSKPDAMTVGRFRRGFKRLTDLVHFPSPTGERACSAAHQKFAAFPAGTNIMTAQSRSAAG